MLTLKKTLWDHDEVYQDEVQYSARGQFILKLWWKEQQWRRDPTPPSRIWSVLIFIVESSCKLNNIIDTHIYRGVDYSFIGSTYHNQYVKRVCAMAFALFIDGFNSKVDTQLQGFIYSLKTIFICRFQRVETRHHGYHDRRFWPAAPRRNVQWPTHDGVDPRSHNQRCTLRRIDKVFTTAHRFGQ